MDKIIKIIQRIMRLLLSLVAIGFFVMASITLLGYSTDKHAKKTAVQAKIVADPADKDKDSLLLKYEYQGTTYYRYPKDGGFMEEVGKSGKNLTVYVNNSNPKRVMLDNPPKYEFIRATFLYGWAILLGLILLAEYVLISKFNQLSAVIANQNKEKVEN